jgi:deazaflavin-dependent oxidoreductase (nitroreductase family)
MAEKPAHLRIPPRGTRGASVAPLLFRLLKPLAGRQVDAYKRAATPEPQQFQGFPTILLTTIGARTGTERTHVLGGFREGDAWLVLATNSGAATHPAWFINMAKNPDKVWLQVGNRRMRVSVESLSGAEREQAYARVAALAPRYNSYLKKTDREIPVVRLTPA